MFSRRLSVLRLEQHPLLAGFPRAFCRRLWVGTGTCDYSNIYLTIILVLPKSNSEFCLPAFGEQGTTQDRFAHHLYPPVAVVAGSCPRSVPSLCGQQRRRLHACGRACEWPFAASALLHAGPDARLTGASALLLYGLDVAGPGGSFGARGTAERFPERFCLEIVTARKRTKSSTGSQLCLGHDLSSMRSA